MTGSLFKSEKHLKPSAMHPRKGTILLYENRVKTTSKKWLQDKKTNYAIFDGLQVPKKETRPRFSADQ